AGVDDGVAAAAPQLCNVTTGVSRTVRIQRPGGCRGFPAAVTRMIPYTIERRHDSGVTNVTLGIWLFLASEVMLFGALFSCYALLRTAATSWPVGSHVLNLSLGSINTVILVVMTMMIWRTQRVDAPARSRMLMIGSILAIAFLAIKGIEYGGELARG